MANELRNPFEIKLIFTVDGDEITLEPSAHFTANCDQCGNDHSKGIALTHTTAQEQQIKDFAKTVWYPQMKEAAGIL